MSYIINNTRGNIVAVVTDGTVNTSATPISLIGRGVIDYGTAENENYVRILENFTNSSPPPNPILGQLWYNNNENVLAVYNPSSNWTDLASIDYVDAQKISPAFTGIPTAPTASAPTNSTQIATTAFVGNAINTLGVATTLSLSFKANIASPALTGVPTATTAAAGTNSLQIATTAFVTSSPTFVGEPIAPTAVSSDSSTQIATTAFVQAQKSSPVFTGFPSAPTADTSTVTTQIATTAFVQAQKSSPVFTGIPIAPTAAVATATTQIATTAFVQAQKSSPVFTGIPTAPTAVVATATTQIATTAFVGSALTIVVNNLGTMAAQNANNVSITGGSITGINALAVDVGGTGAAIPSAARTNLGLGSISTQNAGNVTIAGGAISNVTIDSPTITGIPTAPTAPPGTNTPQVATTAFVTNVAGSLGTMSSQNANAVDITGGTVAGAIVGAYPVGSIYMNASVATNPVTLLGFGSWVALGAGRMLLGNGGGFSVGSTGGAATTALNINNLPGHSHSFLGTTNPVDLSHTHQYGSGGNWGSGRSNAFDARNTGSFTTSAASVNMNHSHNFSGTTEATGSGTAATTISPYLVVYMWQRVA